MKNYRISFDLNFLVIFNARLAKNSYKV